MSDNKNKTGPQDASRINVNEAYELEYWTKKLNVTPDRLRSAVKEAGPSVSAVEEYLRQRKSA